MSDFARKIGVSINTYQHYEYGKRAPSLSFIIAVCHKLDVSADWLLGLDSTPSSSVTATGGAAAAANHSTATVTAPSSPSADDSRLLGIIESQQRIIESQQAVIASFAAPPKNRR